MGNYKNHLPNGNGNGNVNRKEGKQEKKKKLNIESARFLRVQSTLQLQLRSHISRFSFYLFLFTFFRSVGAFFCFVFGLSFPPFTCLELLLYRCCCCHRLSRFMGAKKRSFLGSPFYSSFCPDIFEPFRFLFIFQLHSFVREHARDRASFVLFVCLSVGHVSALFRLQSSPFSPDFAVLFMS